MGCGSNQHRLIDCPKRKGLAPQKGKPGNRTAAQPGKAKVPARAYALGGGDGPEPTDVVGDEVCIGNKTGKVLFDPGATHSFISVAFASELPLTVEILPNIFEVRSPMGMTATTDIIYRDCNVNFKGRIYLANLIKLPIQSYDVILGMDWLYLHHARLDCYSKEVKLGEISSGVPERASENSQNTIMISAIEARNLLKEGSSGYIAYLINRPKDAAKTEEVEVVREFQKFFLRN